MKNLWGILVRRVYEGGKQYVNVHELKVVIYIAETFSTSLFFTDCAHYCPSHLLEVASRQGAAIDYERVI